jgi:DNA repair exonuclease SbcCD ATPase subunit
MGYIMSNKERLEKFRNFLTDTKARQVVLEQQKSKASKAIASLKEEGKYLVEAQETINVTGIVAQTEFQEVIEQLVTQALQYLFGKSYSFELENKIVRNQPETYMYVVIDGQKNSLKDELGGGVLDVVSVALRIVCWALNIENTEPILVFDEPLKFVSKDHMDALGEMLRSLSELLKLQLIMVSHELGLIAIADRAYSIRLEKGVSVVERTYG